MITRIIEGHIKEGEALPSVRTMASELQINPITISKAYQMLQDEQIVEKQRGKGLFVKTGAPEKILIREKQLFLLEDWPKIVSKVSRLKIDINELLSTIKESK